MDYRGIGVQFQAEERNFSVLRSIKTGSVIHPGCYLVGAGGSLPTDKVIPAEADD